MILLDNFDRNLIETLKSCFKNCRECKIAVAYIRSSGLNPIINDLETVLRKGGNVKLLTSNQLGITEKEAIQSLLDIGAEIKVYINYNKTFHPKAYIFKRNEINEYIIGSSNISRSALFDGIEFNLYFDNSYPASTQLEESFDRIWNSIETKIVTMKNIESLFNIKSNFTINEFTAREDTITETSQRTLKEIIDDNIIYPVSKRPDKTTTWKFNLSVNKVNRLLEKDSFILIARCDYESPGEIIFAIPSGHLTRHILPYANQGKSKKYYFEINKRTLQFNWQRSIKMDGKPFVVS
jgi:HKD family nuclease